MRAIQRAVLPLLILILTGSGLTGCAARASAGENRTAAPASQKTGQPAASPAPSSTPSASAQPLPTASPPAMLTDTPSPPATPTAMTCWQDGGRIVQDSLRSDKLSLPMEYRVYLPPCYDQQPDQRYPVLYLIHGQYFNDDQWIRLGADEIADRLITSGESPPFMIVMPRDRLWVRPTRDKFGEVFIEELVPWIDQHYRTNPERSQRVIGGLSRGAGWAIHLGLSHWQMFSAIGAHSLPVFLTDTPKISAWLDAIPLQSMPRIYLDIGEKDHLIRSTLWFEDILDAKSIPHEWHMFPGYHEESYWQAHMEQYLRWYTREW